MKWFRHDSNANNDAKIKKVMMKYGVKGYGLYFYCLELIASEIEGSNDHNFELEHDAEILAYELKMTESEVTEIMTYMIKLEMFDINEGRIRCLKMANRLDDTMTRNPQIKQLLSDMKNQGLLTKKASGNSPRISEDCQNNYGSAPTISDDARGNPAILDYIRSDNIKDITELYCQQSKDFDDLEIPDDIDFMDELESEPVRTNTVTRDAGDGYYLEEPSDDREYWKGTKKITVTIDDGATKTIKKVAAVVWFEKYDYSDQVSEFNLNHEAVDRWVSVKNARGEMYITKNSFKTAVTKKLSNMTVSVVDSARYETQLAIVQVAIEKQFKSFYELNRNYQNAIIRRCQESSNVQSNDGRNTQKLSPADEARARARARGINV